MQILMATARWGPMRLKEIAAMTGDPLPGNRWNQAARHLERLGILIRHKKNQQHLIVGFDRRHPAYRHIHRFAKTLYALYLGPIAVWTPRSERQPLRASGPPHDPAALDLHVLGNKPLVRVLHLLVEVQPCPGWVLLESLGGTIALYASVKIWNKHGIVGLNADRPHAKREWLVHLDTSWRGHRALRTLLEKLNTWLPGYEALGDAYRAQRASSHHTSRWHPRQTGRRRRRVTGSPVVKAK
jgi:hypothetical protein